jgi:tricorn protease
MLPRQWPSPPPRLLALFLSVTLVPAGSLVWLGWRLLQQDRALAPDGKRLAYVSEGVLWTIPTGGGNPTQVQTGLDEARMGKIDWSPDGKTIVFNATRGGEHELWLMENFIHLVKASR